MNPWRGLGGLPQEIWVLFTATLVNRAGTMALPFLVLYLTRRHAFSASQAGLIITVYGIGALITSPLAGRLSDLVGALRVMKISLFLTGALLLLFPLARSYVLLQLLTFIWAIVSEAFRPASMATIASVTTQEQRKPAFALYRLAANLGMSIGPAAGGLLATLSFTWLFLVDGLTTLLAALVLTGARWQHRQHETSPGDSGTSRHERAVLTDGIFLWFLVALFPVVMVFFQHNSSMPLFLVRNLHFAESAYGFLFSINTVLIVLAEVPLNTMTAHWPHRLTLSLGALLSGIGFGSMMFITGFASAALTVAIWTCGEMLLFPAAAAYVTEIADTARRGQYMGIFQMSFSLAFAIGPWLGTQTLEWYGAHTLWGGALLLGLFSALLMLRVSPERAGLTR